MKVAPSLENVIDIKPSSSLDIIGTLEVSALSKTYIYPIGCRLLLKDYKNIVAVEIES